MQFGVWSCPSLLVRERQDRVDAGDPARRQEAGDQRDDRQGDDDGGKHSRVARVDVVEHGLQRAGRQQRDTQSKEEADGELPMLFLITRRTSCSPCAPSADRTPISRVRCVTANDITP